MNIIKNDDSKEKIPKGKGFYIALTICSIAVVAAGWSTYRSVKEFSGATKAEPTKHSSKAKPEEMSKNSKINDKNIKNTVPDKSQQDQIENGKADVPKYNRGLAEEDNDEDVQSVLSDITDNIIVYPTNNNIIKEFSDGKPVYSKTLGDWRAHDGIDFKADRGSLVKSITCGIVKDIYNDPSYGMTIVVEHDKGFISYYSGLGDTTLVNKGDKVKAGQDIGSINDVPVEIAEEPHLHFMINKEGKFIDPILILDKESE